MTTPSPANVTIILVVPSGERISKTLPKAHKSADVLRDLERTHGYPSRHYRLVHENADLRDLTKAATGDVVHVSRVWDSVKMSIDFPKELSTRHHYDFRAVQDDAPEARGGRPYHRPCGSMRFAINVTGVSADMKWLGTDERSWPNGYFGTGCHPASGKRMAQHAHEMTAATEQPLGGTWFFSVERPEDALLFATKFFWKGTECQMYFQARLNPVTLTEINQPGSGSAFSGKWFANERSSDLRPYSIIVMGLPATFDVAQDERSVVLAALNSSQKDVLLVPFAPEALAHTSDASLFSIAACHDRLAIGGPTHPEPLQLDASETVTVDVPWVTGMTADPKSLSVFDDVEVTITGDSATVTGPRSDVQRVCQILRSAVGDTQRPTWTTRSLNANLVALDPQSGEFRSVAAKFHTTMPPTAWVLERVERIENRDLYPKFDRVATTARSNVREVGGDESTAVLQLFHGPSATNPSAIYTTTGFVRNYSSAGFWGRAVYFAVNASYSNGYAFRTPSGSLQMFLASVATGVPDERQRSSSIVRPADRDRGEGKAAVWHDSVKGNTGGSDVYMTYIDNAAYPDYLLTYKAKTA